MMDYSGFVRVFAVPTDLFVIVLFLSFVVVVVARFLTYIVDETGWFFALQIVKLKPRLGRFRVGLSESLVQDVS